ncbi:MAG: hypothetical protein R3F56_01035 [Planctomycetota bacterium]
MRAPTVAVAIVTTLIVGLVVFVDSAEPSPGPLSEVHARDARLSARGGCDLCHGEDRHSLADACLECHELQAKQIADGRGVHGQLGGDVRACGRCHGEHHGAEFELVAAGAFVRAGIEDLVHYDHAGLEYSLTGKHETLKCTACHENAEARVLPAGGTRYAGLDQACATCHDDPHHGKLPDCASCHGQTEKFALAPEFVHIAGFPLTGAHGGLACKRCHEPQTRHSIENTGSRTAASRSDLVIRGCSACHDQPHAEAFLGTVATSLAAGTPPAPAGDGGPPRPTGTPRSDTAGGTLLKFLSRLDTPATPPPTTGADASKPVDATCAHCHPIEQKGFATPAAKMTDELHRLTGFALERPHAELACEKCHPSTSVVPAGSPREVFHTRFPGRDADRCIACHGDPHGDQFAATASVGGADDCLGCHTRHEFKPATFDRERHERTSFPLVGAHVALDCNKCHADAVANSLEPRRFHGTPSTCAACHEDPHGGQFGQNGATDCTRCHVQSHFAPTAFDLQAHAGTDFPLTGAHAAVACSACHLDPAPGTPRRYRGVASTCAGCHEDPHHGRFDRLTELRTLGGETGCVRCHGTDSFASLRQPFDHDRWTDYPLRGAHRSAKCADCHTGATKNPAGLAAAPTRCDQCHQDPHAAQFRVDGKTDCARCHDDAGKFKDVRFDHARTRFPLDEQHAHLDCAACHKTYTVAGAAVVRYRPLGTQCADCHGPVGVRGNKR